MELASIARAIANTLTASPVWRKRARGWKVLNLAPADNFNRIGVSNIDNDGWREVVGMRRGAIDTVRLLLQPVEELSSSPFWQNRHALVVGVSSSMPDIVASAA
jgi:hypothetical protein